MAKTSSGSSKPAQSPASEKQSFGRWLAETILLVLLAVVLAQGIRTFLLESFVIPSGSMIPTIQLGDRVLGEKVTFRFVRKPERGEIVVFDNPQRAQMPEIKFFIKRVIATEGQKVDIRDGAVFVDGEELQEPYVHGQKTLPGTVSTPITIPDGQVWLMGDNRNNSGDSRFFGPVTVSAVRARAFWTYWPVGNMGTLR